MGQEEPPEIQQRQIPNVAPGKEGPLAMVQAGACLAGEQLC